MQVTVTGRKTEITDRFRDKLDEKLERVAAIAPSVDRCEIVWSHEPNPRRAEGSERLEITCFDRRTVVRAEATADREYEALDAVVDKLSERLRRLHDRRKVHKGRPKASVAEATAPLEPVEPGGSLVEEAQRRQREAELVEQGVDLEMLASDPVIAGMGGDANCPISVRTKVHEAQPMALDEALARMELVGHDFFLFVDSGTGQPSVVYRRRGWSYGVIRLDMQTDVSPEVEGAAEPAARAAG
ncbi:ribosomal subunit interface protein [Kytococcus aerolatus]|uniref:Ribosome hibernation promoting factor n=1 Tax=Kytococcus aerolatus TaxID=592308 RepID=A0A212U031_9MICO|nr:ribosome-associated translation inhibitor RaiA [Kytococcus aerolatus]SNC71486.1 ribosomal subunit interface protein [Kytococcus aerolatus]